MSLTLKQKMVISFEVTVVVLAIIALTAEILPEVKAKLIVIPTLILVISLGLFTITKKSFYGR